MSVLLTMIGYQVFLTLNKLYPSKENTAEVQKQTVGFLAGGLTLALVLQMIIGVCHYNSEAKKWKTMGVSNAMMGGHNMMIANDSMFMVPSELIPDRYKLVLVSSKSKRKLFFDQLYPKTDGSPNVQAQLTLAADNSGRGIVKSASNLMKMMMMMKNMMKGNDTMNMMPKDKEQAMMMNKMMQMDKTTMNSKMPGMSGGMQGMMM